MMLRGEAPVAAVQAASGPARVFRCTAFADDAACAAATGVSRGYQEGYELFFVEHFYAQLVGLGQLGAGAGAGDYGVGLG
jgi:hypothetical protein